MFNCFKKNTETHITVINAIKELNTEEELYITQTTPSKRAERRNVEETNKTTPLQHVSASHIQLLETNLLDKQNIKNLKKILDKENISDEQKTEIKHFFPKNDRKISLENYVQVCAQLNIKKFKKLMGEILDINQETYQAVFTYGKKRETLLTLLLDRPCKNRAEKVNFLLEKGANPLQDLSKDNSHDNAVTRAAKLFNNPNVMQLLIFRHVPGFDRHEKIKILVKALCYAQTNGIEANSRDLIDYYCFKCKQDSQYKDDFVNILNERLKNNPEFCKKVTRYAREHLNLSYSGL